MKLHYYKTKPRTILSIDKIAIIHYLELAKDFKFDEESHDFWELIYVDKESIIATVEGEKITVNEGEMLFHKPFEVHSHATDGNTAPNVFVFSFVTKSKVMSFFENKKIKIDKSLVKFIYMIAEEGKKTFNLPIYNPSLTKLELLPSPVLGGEQLVKNLLEFVLIKIIRSETENKNSDVVFLAEENENERITAKIIKFMKEKLEERLTVQDICAEINYNKSYVFKTFKRDTGSTVMDYFSRLKIEKAKQYLREGKLNITQISEKLAFDSPNYFSKTFKKTTGYSPLLYKKIYFSSNV